MRLGGLLGFQVIFQCKHYQGSVGAGQVRDFRGAMVGRADKGLLITTGNFAKDAVREAARDGAPAIDLIDGDLLVDKLKELELGVQTRTIEIEQVTIDPGWFAGKMHLPGLYRTWIHHHRTSASTVIAVVLVMASLRVASHAQSVRDVVISEIAWMGTTTFYSEEWQRL